MRLRNLRERGAVVICSAAPLRRFLAPTRAAARNDMESRAAAWEEILPARYLLAQGAPASAGRTAGILPASLSDRSRAAGSHRQLRVDDQVALESQKLAQLANEVIFMGC